jgi:predicted Zn-dependent peptidase
MYQITRLENGLTVATATMPHMARVSMGFWIRAGGRYEPAELSGVSHFIEHLLFKGTRRRTAKQISQEIEGMGGELNAFTSEEHTCIFCRAPHERFDALLNVLMDMFLHSLFDPVEINKERAVIKEELAMYLDQPQHRVQELLNQTLWPNHPLGRSLTGTQQTLDALHRAQIVGYQEHHYVASNTLVTVAGRLQHRQVVKAVSRFMRRFPFGPHLGFAPAPTDQQRPQVRLFTKATEQTQLALGIRACSRHDDRRFALRLLNTLLGENMSSRLFQVLREDHGLAYSIGSSLGLLEDVGTLTISAGLETGKLRTALKLILHELRRLVATPPARGELQCAKDYLIGQIDLGLENTATQMMWIGEQLAGYGKIITPAEIKRRLGEVTPARIRAVARDFICPQRLCLALVGPLKSDKGLAKLLEPCGH